MPRCPAGVGPDVIGCVCPGKRCSTSDKQRLCVFLHRLTKYEAPGSTADYTRRVPSLVPVRGLPPWQEFGLQAGPAITRQGGGGCQQVGDLPGPVSGLIGILGIAPTPHRYYKARDCFDY